MPVAAAAYFEDDNPAALTGPILSFTPKDSNR
jgi:hypothetical protein